MLGKQLEQQSLIVKIVTLNKQSQIIEGDTIQHSV